jgi:hypothetical protein
MPMGAFFVGPLLCPFPENCTKKQHKSGNDSLIFVCIKPGNSRMSKTTSNDGDVETYLSIECVAKYWGMAETQFTV